MNKRFLKATLFAAMCVSLPASFTSCCDYDDDIKDLQGQIDAVKADVQKLQELVDKGYVITNVASTANGVQFTMSNGQTYEITNGKDGEEGKAGDTWTIGEDGYWYQNGKKTDYRAIGINGTNGTNGAPGAPGEPGKDADVWTIGTDGFWYLNGKKTEHKAIGTDGKDGEDGEDGTDGTDGVNGDYYVPNAETGNFDIYDGTTREFKEDSGISWRNSGCITAVYTGNVLVLSGVEGAEEGLVIELGAPVGSIAFVPSVLSNVGGYPTTDKPFYHILKYFDDAKNFEATEMNLSNRVALTYRINPSDAYIAETNKGAFVNRIVTSRAAGDKTNTVLRPESVNFSGNGEMTVNAVYNVLNSVGYNVNDIAAFQLWNGQDVVTSDYVAPSSREITAKIVNKKNENNVEYFYTRSSVVTTANVKEDVALDAPANIKVAYNDPNGVNLLEYVDLYSEELRATLSEVDFVDATYSFTLKGFEYIGQDNETDMQYFASIEEGSSILKVNEQNLVNSVIPAEHRTPVVLVNAYMHDNDGAMRLVASSYIKIEFYKKTVDLDALKPIVMPTKQFAYSELEAEASSVGKMDWRDVNNKIYGATGLSAVEFWQHYGEGGNKFRVALDTYKADGTKYNLAVGDYQVDQPTKEEHSGVQWYINLNQNNTSTSAIEVLVNNNVLTEKTYKSFEEDGFKGAKYVVTMTIPSDDKTIYPDVVISQTFYVNDDFVGYAPNDNYALPGSTWDNITVETNGKVVDGNWALQMNVEEVFAMDGTKSVFDYYAEKANVVATAGFDVDYKDSVKPEGAGYTATSHVVELTEALTEDKTVEMQYTVQHVNGETHTVVFKINFLNPFKAGKVSAVTVDGTEIDGTTSNAAEKVSVVDLKDAAIYNWSTSAKGLRLSDVAKNTYKLSVAPTVEYSFEKDEEYNNFVGQLAPGSTFNVDGNGEITFDNKGTRLQKSYNLTVKAVVTFDKLSEVEVLIPVQVKGAN